MSNCAKQKALDFQRSVLTTDVYENPQCKLEDSMILIEPIAAQSKLPWRAIKLNHS